MMFNLTTKREIDSNAPDKPGIYRIYWIKDTQSQPINRISGTDTNGLLYIGHTKGSLQTRLNQFRCSAFKKSTNHSGALKYRKINILERTIMPNEIYVEIEPCSDSLKREGQELKKYADKFGEVPPLNG